MPRLPVVAVVGRPNVGKSTLVNRVLKRRAAVVEERPGVTRDRREFTAEWNGIPFLVVDTGGWETGTGALTADIRGQAEAAVRSADLVLFVADATSPLGDDDLAIARVVQKSSVPVALVANKVDGPKGELDLGHLWALGLGEPHPVSALHGRNVGDLLDGIVDMLPAVVAEPEDAAPTIAILGRPNVGKSTLLNRLVGEERVVVSPEPGTTRDPIDAEAEIDGQRYRIVDTAGIRRRSRVDESSEFYSVLRARESLAQADVALLVIDGTEGVTHQEQRLAEEIVESGSGLIVLLNKWDVTDTEQKAVTEDGVGDRLAFVSWAPVLRLSALTGARLHRLGAAILAVLEARAGRIPTPELNRRVLEWQEAHPPPVRRGRRARIMYAVQAGTEPPTIVLFVRGGELGPDYLRFLEGRLRNAYDFLGTPIRLVPRRRPRRDLD
ncbi:MAG TPA: ribosome biogenesis GTPase Der [Acidimicrobiia bacterium]|nr:ribosome biogenesis GTPase Der [Acidimicrobiia bacterium]